MSIKALTYGFPHFAATLLRLYEKSQAKNGPVQRNLSDYGDLTYLPSV